MSSFDFLQWREHRQEFCSLLRDKYSCLKILLKTKNDPFLLENWITHHLQIVGPGNIIVFDNMSNDIKVLETYHKYRSQILITQFSGFHNMVHHTDIFSDLYQTLARSCQFFIFLDTDEFLVRFPSLYEYDKTDAIVDQLSETAAEVDIIPGTWLYNTDWSASRFVCGTREADLANGLAWGKPIVRATSNFSGYINHNVQIDRSLLCKVPIVSNFIVLHMANLSVEQRLRSNINKLASRRIIDPDETLDSICNLDISSIQDRNVIQYVSEIRELSSKSEPAESANPVRPGCLELTPDNRIVYFGEHEKNLISNLLSSPEILLRMAIDLHGTR